MKEVKELQRGDQVVFIFPASVVDGREVLPSSLHPAVVSQVRGDVIDAMVDVDHPRRRSFHKETGISLAGEEDGKIVVPHDVVNDPSFNGYNRFTCRSCKTQVLHQPYMAGHKEHLWHKAKMKFIREHPAIDIPKIR